MATRNGLQRFLSLVPTMSVSEAQARANMSDSEIEILVDICCAVLDEQKASDGSIYDFAILDRIKKLELAFGNLVAIMERMMRLYEAKLGDGEITLPDLAIAGDGKKLALRLVRDSGLGCGFEPAS